jgi:hypothetical protein
MNIQRLILALLAVGLILPASAAEKKASPAEVAQKGDVPEWAELFGGASLAVVWQSASAASDKIAAALAGGKLEGVADWAETIHLAAHALSDQVKLDEADRAVRLKGSLAMAARIADDVLEGANHKEIDEAADAYRRLRSALLLAQSRLPKPIVDAPPQEVRFASGAVNGHEEKAQPAKK